MIAVVTSHFNFADFKKPVANLHRFMQQNPNAYGTELYLQGQTPATSQYPNWQQIKANEEVNILFQKEALLNLTVSRLPVNIDKVAVVDCDIEFMNKNWLNESDSMLDYLSILQPYSDAYWLNLKGRPYDHKKSCMNDKEGMANFRSHPGFAWAIRRNLWDSLELYPYCYLGSGDTALAFALLGMPPFKRNFPHENSEKHCAEWAQKINKWADGKFGYVKGIILHNYHGSSKNRRYSDRTSITDPIDITTNLKIEHGLLTFTDIAKKKTKRYIKSYFYNRNEDETDDEISSNENNSWREIINLARNPENDKIKFL